MEIKIDQLHLVTAMVTEINRQHGGDLAADSDLFNACIAGANLCKDKIDGLDIAVCSPKTKCGK